MDENEKESDEIDEAGLDVEVEINPNVEDQLAEASSESGIADVKEVKKTEEETAPVKTPEELFNEFMDKHPEAREVHGKKTAKRIDKMTWAQKEAERQRDEAIDFAKRTQEEITKLKKNQSTQDGAFINEHKSRLEIQLETIKQDLANAHAINDSSGVAEATAKMAKLTNQLDVATQTETRFRRAREEAPEIETPVYTAPLTTQQPQVDAKAEAWAEKNEWFGEDPEMTQSALAIHRTLVTQDGYLPQTDAYYKELDNRIRKNYPDNQNFKQDTQETTKPGLINPNSLVAPVNSNATNYKPGRVHLSASQVRVAKKLGVPLQEYAKSLEAYNKDK